MRLHFPSTPTDKQLAFLRSLKVHEGKITRIQGYSEAVADLAITLVLDEKRRSREKVAAIKKELTKCKRELKRLRARAAV